MKGKKRMIVKLIKEEATKLFEVTKSIYKKI